MWYVGLDLSRKRLDWQALDPEGERVAIGAVPPDRDGLAKLVQRLGDAPVLVVIESMSGARFVHDRLELACWEVRISDAVKARGAGAAGLQDRQDRLLVVLIDTLTSRSTPASASCARWAPTTPTSRC